MRIYLRELKANVKSLLIYTGVVAFFVVVGFQKFTAYAENPEILDVLDSMPKAMLDTFYMNAFNLTTVEGFFGVMYAFVALILAIAAVMWGSEIISKEERDKTVEFALTLPVKRSTLITAKAAAALTNCILLALATWGLNAVSASGYDPGPEFYTFLFQGMLEFVRQKLVGLEVIHRPDDAVGVIFIKIGQGEMHGHERRIGPVHEAGGQSVVLRHGHPVPEGIPFDHIPVGVFAEVAQQMAFELDIAAA